MEDRTPALFDSKEFSGKRILVTGGTKRGIGEAVVKRLAQAGVTVITTARKPPEQPMDSDLFVQADISIPEGTAKIMERILERFGGVDILVNNVGGSSTQLSAEANGCGLAADVRNQFVLRRPA